MGRKLKKGKTGNVAQYITRNQAIRKLQLRLSEFRRLSILKGIHPREPKKKVHGANKTYYHVKDINWLMHEPLLNTFRSLKVHDRKVRRAKAKANHSLAVRLQALKPTYRLDHLIKERYPSFVDALRDLDDPLTMVHLFATLPAEKRCGIPVKVVETARRLAMEFQAYVVKAHALRRVFISVKGFYYQAELMGQPVTWLVPHQLSQVLPADVDFRIMLTFLEYYQTLLQFVNFKLYHILGLRYPPVLDPKMEEAAAGLAAIMKELAGMREQVDADEDAARVLQGVAAAAAGAPALEVSSHQQLVQQQEQQAGLQQRIKEMVGGADADGADGTSADEEAEETQLDIDSGGDDSGLSDDGASDDVSDDDYDGHPKDDSEAKHAQPGSSAATNSQALIPHSYLATGQHQHHQQQQHQLDEGQAAAGGALEVSPDDEAAVCGALFRGLVFFLAREVPREPLLFIIRAFGGVAAWDGEGSPLTENNDSITHQVVDRPTQGHKFLSRHYVQPQWVVDSSNFRVLLPPQLYAPGQAPPPHLSPFTNDDEEGYTPEFAKTIRTLQEAAKAARARAAGLAEGRFVGEDGEATGNELALATAALDEEALAEKVEVAYVADLTKELKQAAGSPADGEEDERTGLADSEADEQAGGSGSDGSDDEQGADDSAERRRGGGVSTSQHATGTAAASSGKKRGVSAAELEAADAEAMKDIMMTTKARKFYGRIQRSIEGKRARVEALEEKAAALAKSGSAAIAAPTARVVNGGRAQAVSAKVVPSSKPAAADTAVASAKGKAMGLRTAKAVGQKASGGKAGKQQGRVTGDGKQ